MVQLSIIIVNYKSIPLVLDCLRTVHAHTQQVSYEVIIVNNDDDESGAGTLAAGYPGTRWIHMGYNAGFARANNAGIRHANGDMVLLLNPDTLIEPQAIDRCYMHFIQSTYSACGVRLLNPDGSPQISGNYFMRGGLNYLLPLPFMGGLLRKIALGMRVKKPHVPDATETVEVDWINGAYLMVRKSAIGKAGLLDEDFFLYAEEAEWCYRLKKTGPLCIFGDCSVIHLQGETANETFNSAGKGYFNLFDKKGKQIMVSNLVRIRKQFGAGWFLFILFFYCLEIPVFFIGLLLQRIWRGKKGGYHLSQWNGYCVNVGAVFELSPAILKNKPHFYKVL